MPVYTLDEMRAEAQNGSHNVRKQELVRLLVRHGFERVHVKGSHEQWKHAPTQITLTLSEHGHNPQMLPDTVRKVVVAISSVIERSAEQKTARPVASTKQDIVPHIEALLQADDDVRIMDTDRVGMVLSSARYPELGVRVERTLEPEHALVKAHRELQTLKHAHRQELQRLQDVYGIVHSTDHFGRSSLHFPWMGIAPISLVSDPQRYAYGEGYQPVIRALAEAQTLAEAYQARVRRVESLFEVLGYSMLTRPMKDETTARVMRYDRLEAMETAERYIHTITPKQSRSLNTIVSRNPFLKIKRRLFDSEIDAIDPTLVIYDSGINPKHISADSLVVLEKALVERLAYAKGFLQYVRGELQCDNGLSVEKALSEPLAEPVVISTKDKDLQICLPLLPTDSADMKLAKLFQHTMETFARAALMVKADYYMRGFSHGAGLDNPHFREDMAQDLKKNSGSYRLAEDLRSINTQHDLEQRIAPFVQGYVQRLEGLGFVKTDEKLTVNQLLPEYRFMHPKLTGRRFVLPAFNIMAFEAPFAFITGAMEMAKAVHALDMQQEQLSVADKLKAIGAHVELKGTTAFLVLPEHLAFAVRTMRLQIPGAGFEKAAKRFNAEVEGILGAHAELKQTQARALGGLRDKGWSVTAHEHAATVLNETGQFTLSCDVAGIYDVKAMKQLLQAHAPDLLPSSSVTRRR